MRRRTADAGIMKKVTEDEIGAKAMALLDEAGDEGVFITRERKIVAQLTPLRSGGHLIGALKGWQTQRTPTTSCSRPWTLSSATTGAQSRYGRAARSGGRPASS